MVQFDLVGVEDAQEECKVGSHAEEKPGMDCESDGGEDGERARKPSGSAMWCPTCRSRIGADTVWLACVAGRGLEQRHQKHPGHDDQHPFVCIDCGYLSGDATPMLVAKDRVESQGAADSYAVEKPAVWVDALDSTQVTIRSDG